MKPKTLLIAVATAALVAPTLNSREVELRHRHAFEVEVETERGHYYRIQRSTNLVHWDDVSEPVFGDDRPLNRMYRMHGGGRNHEYFRVVVTAVTNADLAPWSFAGVSISLNDDGLREFLNFETATNGAKVEGLETDPFTYTFSRTAENEATVDLNLGHVDRHTSYRFTFATAGSGTFVREEFREGRLKDRDLGAFHVLSGMTNLPPAGTNTPSGDTNAIPTEPPLSLAGLVYLFQTGETPDRLTFLSETTGFENEDNIGGHDDTGTDPFTYAYSLEASNSATLVVTFDTDKRDEYALRFTSGAQGTFVRREFRDGVLKDTDMGAFSPTSVMSPVNDTNAPPAGTNHPPVTTNAPADVIGHLYLVATGETPDRLNFVSATAGSEAGDNPTPNAFTYTYSATGPNTASIVVQFKADRWDEYDWIFTGGGSGTFVRREFRDGVLNDTDSGTFSRVTVP